MSGNYLCTCERSVYNLPTVNYEYPKTKTIERKRWAIGRRQSGEEMGFPQYEKSFVKGDLMTNMIEEFVVAAIPYEFIGDDTIGERLGGVILFDIPFEVLKDVLISHEDVVMTIPLRRPVDAYLMDFFIYNRNGTAFNIQFKVEGEDTKIRKFEIRKGDDFPRHVKTEMGSSAGIPHRTPPLS